MPKFDFSALLPVSNIASSTLKIDTTAIAAIASTRSISSRLGTLIALSGSAVSIPKSNYASLIPETGIAAITRAQGALVAGLPVYSKMLGGFRTDLFTGVRPQIDLTATLQPLLELFRSFDWDSITKPLRVPDNWPDDVHDRLPELLEVVNRDGIPAAWVPRVDVLTLLLNATDGDERSEVLVEHRDEILEDCSNWLDDLCDPVLNSVLPIAREVLDACHDGYWKVGAISAVQVVHSVVESLHWVSDRQRVAKHHVLTMDTPYSRMLEQAARAPLVLFYDDWNPLSGKPRPAHLTRHVVSHRLGEDQVNDRNCIVAVMLMASLLVTVYQLDLGQKELAA
ncbi:hypothetical protein [Microbacterium sp. SL75]|uniref:hypothetical protein n=1 Tax=Microbacterium sp. SL75 TaxID=2995140 RepID=UPI0022702346|nr:hypothetical protein [Microbacterium sp. SL75]WAC69230.1 hypothetical protein OVA17_00580 [Microbacterium sp. SL75]